jgi:hypothetical protein
MYRIHFDHNIGRFVIQVLVYGFFWRDVAKSRDDEPISERATFSRLEEAKNYVKLIGLDKLYDDKSADRYRQHMSLTSAQGAKSYGIIRNDNGDIVDSWGDIPKGHQR